jgi:integrase/recombinase XerD
MVKQKIALTVGQIEELIKNATTIQEKLIIKCLLKMGMRVSELVNFKISWIHFKDNMIRIQENKKPIVWSPKYCSEREVPVPENLIIELKQFLGNRRRGYVFKSRKSNSFHRYNETSIIHKINKISKKVFGESLGTHVFRRTYASFLLKENHDLETIKQRLGHSDIKTTFLYIKDIPDRRKYNKTRNMEIMNL